MFACRFLCIDKYILFGAKKRDAFKGSSRLGTCSASLRADLIGDYFLRDVEGQKSRNYVLEIWIAEQEKP